MVTAVCIDPETELIFEHFGHAEHFKLYVTEGEDTVSEEVIPAGGSGHEALSAFLSSRGVEVLICGGIGDGARTALDAAGITVYGGIRGYADAAVMALTRGVLAYNPEPTCDHHAHEEGGCHCHTDGGCGCGCGE